MDRWCLAGRPRPISGCPGQICPGLNRPFLVVRSSPPASPPGHSGVIVRWSRGRCNQTAGPRAAHQRRPCRACSQSAPPELLATHFQSSTLRKEEQTPLPSTRQDVSLELVGQAECLERFGALPTAADFLRLLPVIGYSALGFCRQRCSMREGTSGVPPRRFGADLGHCFG